MKSFSFRIKNNTALFSSGAVCKLYFDLEFDKEKNSERNGDDMVQTLIKV